jgi:uncharacterized protein YndB with AHSA1/START domain
MTVDNLQITTKLQIRKPVNEVFESIVDPQKMSNFFISKSSGRIEEGKTLMWAFPEFEGEFPVRIERVVTESYISFYWDDEDGIELFVEMFLESIASDQTLVTITEKEQPNNEKGIKWLKNNTEGWANFLACLKAYSEFGVNLREGGFDFMRKPAPEKA